MIDKGDKKQIVGVNAYHRRMFKRPIKTHSVGNTFSLHTVSTLLFVYAELGAETNLEIITLFYRPPTALPLGRSTSCRKGLGFQAPNLRFFWVWVSVRVCYLL